MAEVVKEKDFVEIEYTGAIKEGGAVFDTTDRAKAKDAGLEGKNAVFGPVIICIGEGMILKGLENKIIGRQPGKYTIPLTAEEGFGKKSAGLIQLISTAKFKKQNIRPMPGLQVEVDGTVGTIKTVTGGRTMVDFNHPLASRDITYNINIIRVLTDPREKAVGYLKTTLHIEPKAEISNGVLKLTFERELPSEIAKMIGDKLTALIPDIKKVEFGKQEAKKDVEKAGMAKSPGPEDPAKPPEKKKEKSVEKETSVTNSQ